MASYSAVPSNRDQMIPKTSSAAMPKLPTIIEKTKAGAGEIATRPMAMVRQAPGRPRPARMVAGSWRTVSRRAGLATQPQPTGW